MATQIFALGCGIGYALLGILAFIPNLLWNPEMERPSMAGIGFHGGYLGGFIAVNWPHNILWLLLGVAGIVAAARYEWAKRYGQGVFAVATMLMLVGLLPLGIGDLWGFLPLSSWNVPLNTIAAIMGWYYGFVYPYARELRLA